MANLFLDRREANYKMLQNISNNSPGSLKSESHRMIFRSYLERAERNLLSMV